MPSSRDIFARIDELGLAVPPAGKPNGLYDMVTIHNGTAYTSGQLSRVDNEGNLISGRISAGEPLDEAKRAATICLLRGLNALHDKLGDLSRIERFLFVRGFINADAHFDKHSQVLDQVSELIIDLFGEGVGRHSRSALGAGSLPSKGLVEIEFVVALNG